MAEDLILPEANQILLLTQYKGSDRTDPFAGSGPILLLILTVMS